jgi:hypothetical protein
MSIECLKQFITDTRTAVPLFAAKVLQSANNMDYILSGLILGTFTSAFGAVIGNNVGAHLKDSIGNSEWAPHMSSLGAAAGAYVGGKWGELCCFMVDNEERRIRRPPGLAEGARASHLITMPFTLAQYGPKTAIATALAMIHFGKQIVRGTVWAASSAKESFTHAQVLNGIRRMQETNEEKRARGELNGWSHEVDRLILNYAE